MGNPFSTSYPQTINYSTATTTQNQGGGNKKAGNVPTKNVSAWTMIYYHSRGLVERALRSPPTQLLQVISP